MWRWARLPGWTRWSLDSTRWERTVHLASIWEWRNPLRLGRFQDILPTSKIVLAFSPEQRYTLTMMTHDDNAFALVVAFVNAIPAADVALLQSEEGDEALESRYSEELNALLMNAGYDGLDSGLSVLELLASRDDQ